MVMMLAARVWGQTDAEKVEFFEKKIRPVLAQECYECHSTAKKKKAGLVLDSRPGWEAGGESGEVIVRGNGAGSLLLQSMRHEHEDLKMPKNGAKLDDNVLADFKKWIEDGAVDPRDKPSSDQEVLKDTDWTAVLARRKEWWAFQPPAVANDAPQTVDGFLQRKLDEAGLKPSSPASAEALLRRLYYVLTGLPPSVADIAAFQAAAATDRRNAVESMVDTLLASERFGEKWARHWMDWVRYAESYGSEGDPSIPYAWRYRDYLIRAFNADVPYPQMLKEAIAGDLLKAPRINKELGINESALGIAQLRMVLHGFSPTDTLDEMVTFTDNQIDVVSKAFQAMTVSCARCHNHKFDAIGQTDFYAWFGIFSSTHPGVIDANAPGVGDGIRAELVELKSQIKQALAASWTEAAKKLPVKTIAQQKPMPEIMKRWDLSTEPWFAHGQAAKVSAGEFSVALDSDRVIERVYPAGVFSDLVSTRDRAVLMSPKFRCDGGTLWIRSAGGGASRARYIVQNYPRTGTIHKAKEFSALPDEELGWRKLDLNYWKGDDLFIECTTAADMPVETKPGQRSWFGITEVVITPKEEAPPEPLMAGDPAAAVAHWIAGRATSAEAELINRLLREGKLPNGASGPAGELVKRYRALEAKLPEPTRAPGVLEADAYDAKLMVQGDHKRQADPVKRRFLEAIQPEPYATKQSGRLELAESLAAASNPLTSRVIVNRLWHHVFGRGLVGTTDNFGRLGEKPSHPELLDWLAVKFVKNGGSMKQMIRELVLSDAFARSADIPDGAATKDPENHLLSHWTVRRLEAEAIRDSILAVSGKLDTTLYGEPVGGSSTRRSVYVQVIRNKLDPFLTAFDAPVPSATRGRRDSTNVPAQSLTLMNNPTIQAWAEDWAQRVALDPELKSDEERVVRMMQEATGKVAEANAVAKALEFVKVTNDAQAAQREHLLSLREQERGLARDLEGILGPVRAKLVAQKGGKSVPRDAAEPYAEWDFEDGAKDLKGRLPLTLLGAARVDNGALILDGNKSFARSVPLPKTLKAKTLEAWVMLDDLKQAGGGVVTVQDLKGNVFDSIVFAEKDAGCWLAGSNFHSRTESFEGPSDQEAHQRPVHVAIAWHPDGKTVAYRDGIPYGKPYVSSGAVGFEANKSEVLLGNRHGSPTGNHVLRGRILRARVYDRALSAEQIALTRQVEESTIAEKDVWVALTTADRAKADALREKAAIVTKQVQEAESQQVGGDGADYGWSSLALSLLNLKEFIYLR